MTEQRPLPAPQMPGGRPPSRPTYEPGERLPGRPSKLTREVEEKLLMALRAGNTLSDAAEYCGLPRQRIWTWVARGEGRTDRPVTVEYVRFARMVHEARATAKVMVTGNLVARSRVDTAAALAWLKRFGDAAWSDDEGTPAGTPGATYIDARSVTVGMPIELPPEAVQDYVHRVLETRRQERLAEPQDPEPPPAVRRIDGASRLALDDLRDEGPAETD